MKFFRFLILVFCSLIQTYLSFINFYMVESNRKFDFFRSPLFLVASVLFTLLVYFLLIYLIKNVFCSFIDDNSDNSEICIRNTLIESFSILFIYNIICLILLKIKPSLYEHMIFGPYNNGKYAINNLFIFIVGFMQSVYVNIFYKIRAKIEISPLSLIGRQIFLSVLFIIPYFNNILAYVGK